MYTPRGELNDALLKLFQDPKQSNVLENCASWETAYETAKQYVPELSMEEFQKNIRIMADYLEESKDGILDEEELDSVAGGKAMGGFPDVTDAQYKPERDLLRIIEKMMR